MNRRGGEWRVKEGKRRKLVMEVTDSEVGFPCVGTPGCQVPRSSPR